LGFELKRVVCGFKAFNIHEMQHLVHNHGVLTMTSLQTNTSDDDGVINMLQAPLCSIV